MPNTIIDNTEGPPVTPILGSGKTICCGTSCCSGNNNVVGESVMDQAPQAKCSCKIAQPFFCILFVAYYLSMVVIGALYKDNCGMGFMDVTTFLLTHGGVGLVMFPVKLLFGWWDRFWESQWICWLRQCVFVAQFAIAIWGAVIVFGNERNPYNP